jgi:hypothetical protein
MVVKDSREKGAALRPGSDPGELLDLVRAAEEEATIAARDRSSSDVMAIDPDRPSGEVFEVGDEVLEAPAEASPAATSAKPEPPRSWPPLATVPLLLALAIAALALCAR